MNTSTRTQARDTKGRFMSVILAVTEPTVLAMRGPDSYEDGMAIWIGDRAAVSVPIERADVHDLQEILNSPRFVEFTTPNGGTGWSRLSTEHYGAVVQLFPAHDTDDDVPTAQESWDLLAEVVGL